MMNCWTMFWLLAGSPAHALKTASFMLNMPEIQGAEQDAEPPVAEKSEELQPVMGCV